MGSILSTIQGDTDQIQNTVEKCQGEDAMTEVPSLDEEDEVGLPLFHIEHAKSGRSKCRQTGDAKKCGDDCLIGKGALRVGQLNTTVGTYGKWQHLECWKIPAAIHDGLPNPKTFKTVKAALMTSNLLSGLSQLHPVYQNQVLVYIMEEENWVQGEQGFHNNGNHAKTNPTRRKSSRLAKLTGSSSTKPYCKNKSTVAPFVIPVPGFNGASANSMKGKRVVLTGIFPELGGGTGLDLGKAQVKSMVESFGGRVNVAISGLTSVLVAGKEPGFVKVREARQRGVPIIGIHDLQQILQGLMSWEEAASIHVTVEEFSNGYKGNGAGNRVSWLEYHSVATGRPLE